MHVKFCTSEKALGRHIQDVNFHSFRIISKNLVAVFSNPPKVTLDRPIAIGMVILDKSKDLMLRAYYRDILPRLKGTKVSILWSDTDSFGLKCVDKQPTCHISKIADLLDFSNYNPKSRFYDASRPNALFYFKNELPDQTLEKFCGLRSKTYALKVSDDATNTSKLTVKSKGICRGYKKNLNFEHFEKCIKEISTHSITQFHIRSKNHQVATEKCQRVCFNSFDSKRYLHSACQGE